MFIYIYHNNRYLKTVIDYLIKSYLNKRFNHHPLIYAAPKETIVCVWPIYIFLSGQKFEHIGILHLRGKQLKPAKQSLNM